MRHRPRLDTTQRAIVEALRKAGASVYSLAAVGGGMPDLLVGVAGRTFLLECKSPRAFRKDGSLSPKDRASVERQQAWRAKWNGERVHQVTTPLAALWACGISTPETEAR